MTRMKLKLWIILISRISKIETLALLGAPMHSVTIAGQSLCGSGPESSEIMSSVQDNNP